MLTPERINEIAEEFYEDMGDHSYQAGIPIGRTEDFARKMLAEIKLEDMLKQESDFIMEHRGEFEKHFYIAFHYVVFGTSEIIMFNSSNQPFDYIEYGIYYSWKQSLHANTGGKQC